MADATAHLLCGAAALLLAAAAVAAPTEPCRLKGVDREVRCGRVVVPENPDAPEDKTIEVHYAVVPALARARTLEPVFVFAGGPGQSARRVAGQVMPLFARLNARRDVVFVDQRGTGLSAPLVCDAAEQPGGSLAEMLDAHQMSARLRQCLERLAATRDLRQYATWIAMRDIDAVRTALGHERINLWGASYGTRAALEYLRQFPKRVRSVVIDGVAPADMALPASFSVDSQTSLDRLLAACAADASCSSRYPDPAASVDGLLERAASGIAVAAAHPLTGRPEEVRLERAAMASILRVPLYLPPMAAVLPYALAEASRDRFEPLLALASMISSSVSENFAEGMHFAVICAEDMPRIGAADRAAAAATRFGTTFLRMYAEACAVVPKRPVPEAFYSPSNADVPVLALSGGADPATPPRHGERVTRALKRATHVVAPNLGHGVSSQGCGPELVTGFIREAGAGTLDLGCLERLPAPVFFAPPGDEARR
jgi:pimeloyl-ACP methyl ester carboxylesterase